MDEQFEIDASEYQWLSSDFYNHTRKSNDRQLWIAGCSITHGVGVSEDQTYKNLLSKYYNLEYTDLSYPGSSIIWQSDQICRSNLLPNDIVFWGLTGQYRLPVIHEYKDSKKIFHLHPGVYTDTPHLKKQFPLEVIRNSSLFYHNVLAVRRVYNFCKVADANLVILGLTPDAEKIYLNYNVPVFRQIISGNFSNCYVDLGTDRSHPGPEQHKIFAQKFINFYDELYKD